MQVRVRIVSIAAAAVAVIGAVACTTTTEVTSQTGATTSGAATTQNEGDPKRRAAVRLQLASTYYEQRQYQIALDEIQRVLQVDPENAAALGLRGLVYFELKDNAQAEANFGRALRAEPDNPELNNNYGWFLCRTGRERESVAHFQRAAADKLYRTPALAMRNAGQCQMNVRDYPGAELSLKRAFEMDAADPLTKFHLTRLYIALRHVERARFYHGLLEKAIGESAETTWLALRIARIDGDVRSERQFSEDLRRRYPQSSEAAALRRGAFDE
jgi:type IV pilus assembly protein PilF